MTVQDVLRYDATLGTPAHDDADVPWTEDEVLRHLWRHFVAQSWAPIAQVSVRTTSWQVRRIDLLLARPARKQGIGPIETLSVEVKVTRGDFLADVKAPEKQAPWRAATHRHAYAFPEGLIHPSEVPDESGVLVVKRAGPGGHRDVKWARRAPYRKGHNPVLPAQVQTTLLHRLATVEARTRGWTEAPSAAAADETELRAKIAALEAERDRLSRQVVKAEGKADAWQGAYGLLAADGHPCVYCGHSVKPLHAEHGTFRSWRHVDKAHDAVCAEVQTRDAYTEARMTYEAASDAEREREATRAHRFGFNEVVGHEPWRAFLPGYDATFRPHDPRPANTAPTTEGEPP